MSHRAANPSHIHGPVATKPGHSGKRAGNRLLAISSVAVLAVYAAGWKAKRAQSLLVPLSGLMALSVVTLGLFGGAIFDAVVAIVTGVVVAALATLTGRWLLGAAGALLGLAGMLVAVVLAIGFDSVFNWGSLSFLGVLFVVLAAVAERNRGHIIQLLERAHGSAAT